MNGFGARNRAKLLITEHSLMSSQPRPPSSIHTSPRMLLLPRIGNRVLYGPQEAERIPTRRLLSALVRNGALVEEVQVSWDVG
jgi:hypothetical protein